MAIYEDGYTIIFDDDTSALVSGFFPSSVGAIVNEIIYTIRDDDTLFSISSAFYKGTSYWYLIAEWNNIIDILDLVVGTEIKIPQFG